MWNSVKSSFGATEPPHVATAVVGCTPLFEPTASPRMQSPPCPHLLGCPMFSSSQLGPAKPRSHVHLPLETSHVPQSEQPSSSLHGPGGGDGGSV